MKLIKAFQKLLMEFSQKEVKHYIGLGNPNAKILIIGKECAHEEGSTSAQQECSNNYNQWMKLVEKGHGFINEEEIPQWDGSWETFCPFAPYNKPQRFTIERKKGDKIISGAGGTSATWYNYQKLINYIRELGKLDNPVNTSTIDFYKDCFITELNEKCRVNNYGLSVKERQETEENIRQRFDLMKETKSFWSHFDTVILACGPYADALRKDQQLTRDIFGDAKVISTINNRNVPQLSIAISNELLREIAKQVEIKNQHTLR